jgi:glycosyltransferase involved in cell wall biosynthesis
MNILLIHNEYQQPGGEDVVFRQEQQLLARFGHKVRTYVRSNREVAGASSLNSLRQAGRLFWAEGSRKAVANILAESKPDVVHVHNTFFQISPSIYTACRDLGVPVVQTLHNFRLLCPAATLFRGGEACEECVDRGLSRSVAHACYRGSRTATAAVAAMLSVHRGLRTWAKGVDTYVALTEFARDKFIRGGLPRDRIFVKPNFVYPDPGTPAPKQDYAIFVGRLSEEKGPQILLRAWTHLERPIPLLVVGDGPLRAELETYARDKGLSHVSFRGRLPQSETRRAIQSASFLIQPSQCYENFPMAIVEAFATGTPVVCTGMGAMREIVEDGRTGLHFQRGSSEELAQKAAWLHEHPSNTREMGMEAREEFEANFTAERNHSLLMDIYRRVSQPHSTAAAVEALSPFPTVHSVQLHGEDTESDRINRSPQLH